jgi:hypothetical protein
MEGYEVISSDDRKVGRVVEVKGDNVIVEHGLLRKTRQAIPKPFAHSDTSETEGYGELLPDAARRAEQEQPTG